MAQHRASGPPPERWEKQLEESPPAFAAFAVYRDMGPERSIRDVAKQLSKDDAKIFGWSSRYGWVNRAHCFDAHNDRLKTQTDARHRVQMLERQTRSSMLLQAKALETLQHIEPDMLTTTDIVRWLDVGIKLERLSRGAVSPEDAGKSAYQALWERLGGPDLERSGDS